MSKVLSLDISSSTIGWSILKFKKNNSFPSLKKYGYIKPSKNGSLSERALDAKRKYIDLLKTEKPDFVVVEDYASKFSHGKSTARTIIVLAVFNETIKIATLESLNINAISYPVRTIRSIVEKELSQPIKDKEEVLNFCIKNFKNYKTVLNRNKRTKKECYDECDAIAVGICHYLKTK